MAGYEKINYLDKGIKKYERDILTLGLCDSFLPVSFVEDRNMIKGIYDCRNYEKLCDIDRLRCDECLGIMINLINNAVQTERHCIFAEDVDYRIENCFVSRENGDVKFLFIRDSNRISFKEKMLRIMDYMSENLSEKEREVFRKAAAMAEQTESSRAIAGFLESLRRELNETKP